MTRTTSQLDLFDNRQADLFAASPRAFTKQVAADSNEGRELLTRLNAMTDAVRPELEVFAKRMGEVGPEQATAEWDAEKARRATLAEEQAIAEAEAAAERNHPDYADADENERGEWRDESEREHYRILALSKTAKIERLVWMEGKKRGYGRGQSHIELEWFENDGRFYATCSRSYGSGSSSGPFREVDARSRNDVILGSMRKTLRDCAYRYAFRDRGSDGEANWKAAEKAARWSIEQCPPLMFGVDLAQEFDQMKTQAVAAETERRQVLGDVDKLRDQLVKALYASQGQDCPEHMSDWFRNTYKGTEPLARADAQVQGDWPNRLRVMIYSAGPHYQGSIEHIGQDTPEQLEALRAAIAARMSIPVMLAPIELQTAHYYPVARREVTWPSDPHRAYHLRVLQMEETEG